MNIKYCRSVLMAACTLISVTGLTQDAAPYMPGSYTPTSFNYIRTWDVKAPITDPAVVVVRPLRDVLQTTQYIDGLGRPLQTVIKQGSWKTGASEPKDLVAPVAYDAFGRVPRTYLPYASTE